MEVFRRYVYSMSLYNLESSNVGGGEGEDLEAVDFTCDQKGVLKVWRLEGFWVRRVR